uniref:VWFA domain-containing protein n=1 Tax=Phytophthora ramorum TaxID=164328 RepID=H3GXA2_PHYRM
MNQVDVLRLCRSLGMAVSDEDNTVLMHKFEFGEFDPSKYDADFARFIREKLAVGSDSSVHHEDDLESEEVLDIGSLFGKQSEVKAELDRLGFWDCNCESDLSVRDQGVFCIERCGGRGAHRQFVAFAWLGDSLFEPETIRGIPANVVFVGGAFPAIAVESATPSTTEVVTDSAIVTFCDFADWIVGKHLQFALELPHDEFLPTEARETLLHKFNRFPEDELVKLQDKFDEQLAAAKQRIGEDVSDVVQGIHNAMERDADLLFAVRNPATASQMDGARARYQDQLKFLNEFHVLSDLEDEMLTTLFMPERMQEKMRSLHDAYVYNSPEFDAILDWIMNGGEVDDSDNNSQNAMHPRQARFQRRWVDTIGEVMSKLSAAMRGQRIWQSTTDRGAQLQKNKEAAMNEAYDALREFLKRPSDRQLCAKVSRISFNPDCSAVNIKWSEEAEKEPTRAVRMYQLSSSPVQVFSLGSVEFEPGVALRKLAAVGTNQVVAVFVKGRKTLVRRLQFPVQLDPVDELEADDLDVRTFPKACLLCSVRANDRRVAFAFGGGDGRLGTVALYRFNESFSRLDAMREIDMDATFRLTAPFSDILLTERSLCALDANGDLQSFDLRTRQTSKKVSLGRCDSNASGLLCFSDELVLGRAGVENGRLRVDSISSEDHRALPSAVMGDVECNGLAAVGCVSDVLYVINATGSAGVVYASKLKVTVRSDAYRIQRYGNGARSTRLDGLRVGQHAGGDTTEHWLRVFFHVFEKFPVRSLLDSALSPQFSCPLAVSVAVTDNQDESSLNGVAEVTKEYFRNVMIDLRRLNKPLSGLDLSKSLTCTSSLQTRSVRRVLTAIVSFVPVQICRAEDNMLRLLRDGQDAAGFTNADNSSDSSDSAGTEASEIAQSIRFGLLSPLLESWSGRCAVVTSMGKQSTGKSYFLNHLTGTTFAISGSRCTDGAWMSLRFLSADILLVVLDFEGLGSFERSEQEDIFLSVLNASVSLFTVFRMESRFDKDIDGLFSRFQKGVPLIKNDSRLFRGFLYLSVKDVNMNDQQGVIDELAAKLNTVFEASREQNFLTEMYAGQVVINCTPPFGTMEFYQSMENDATKHLRALVAQVGDAAAGFRSGKDFLDCLRLVLAKISILDWTSMDKSTQNLRVTNAKQKLPGILRTGCHVPQSLVADVAISPHLKEAVVKVGTRDKAVLSLTEVYQAYPGFVTKWMALNAVISLDGIADDSIDFGFDVSLLDATKLEMIQNTLLALFRMCLALQSKDFDKSRLTVEDQKSFDAFVAFVLRRRKLKVSRWLRGAVVSVSTWNADEILRPQRRLRALAVLATKGNANVKRESTLAGTSVCSLELRTVTKLAQKWLNTLATTGALCKCTLHSVHKCTEMQCLHECFMTGCKNICGEKDHFHGQVDESRAFAEENGIALVVDLSEDSVAAAAVTHMCLGSHPCTEVCAVDGICEQKVCLKKSSRTYTGARGSFEYIYQEMNGSKKQCARGLGSGEQSHSDAEHSCLAQSSSDEANTVHYCDVRCPSCSYYCNKHHGHMGLHATSHGNMQKTHFLAKDKDIDIDDRKYQVGERGIAEMCNLFCTKMGRGHLHYLPCEGNGREKCVYTADASKDHRRHCEEELYPPPARAMDELLHAQFWTTIGWEDPSSEEERVLFAKCQFQCNAPEHDEEGKALSYCALNAWHQYEIKPEIDDGFAYVDGHKFACVHAVDSGRFHNIFVLDSSGSMNGQPWTDLLYACKEFGSNRWSDGGDSDVVSYVTFASHSNIHCEAVPLGDTLEMKLPFSGTGTSFEEGLRAANEVLSRNDFEKYKPVLIFFSDGHPRDINLGIALAQHIRSTYAKYDLKAFVVGFGNVNLPVLERMAAEMGGEYRHVLNGSELRMEFQRIAAVMRENDASLLVDA